MDELSNWYVRRNRRRFWKGELDDDKRAAYQTLHEVLTTLTRVLAPFIPHVTDAMWRNLVVAVDRVRARQRPPGRLPVARGRADADIDRGSRAARRVVALGRTARAGSGFDSPAAPPRAGPAAGRHARLRRGSGDVAAELEGHIREELNVSESSS